MSAEQLEQKQIIINRLKEDGCRITKQRLMLLDIILEDECSSCKEIYYRATKKDPTIGTATVYRMINTLEDMGAIQRNAMYKIPDKDGYRWEECYKVGLPDGSTLQLSSSEWNEIVKSGLMACGYVNRQQAENITVVANSIGA